MDDFDKRFKRAIEDNFDASASIYDTFELKHHLFEKLTLKLTELIGIRDVSRLLDVGCGTGISTHSLYRCFGDDCSYYGLDISQNMLEVARNTYSNYVNFIFVHGDAANLREYFFEHFDAIFFTASIFLIPEYKKSILDALSLLNEGGRVAMSFYLGISDIRGNDLISKHFQTLTYRYGYYKFDELLEFLKSTDIHHITTDFLYPAEKQMLFDFLSIPAQASGLFPKKKHSTQIELVKNLVDEIFSREEEAFLKWSFIVCDRR